MARVQKNVRKVTKGGTQYPAIIVDAHGGRASARLSMNGATVHHLQVIGGPVEIGDVVSVDYTTPEPTIVATSKEWATQEDIDRAIKKIVDPEYEVAPTELDKVILICMDEPSLVYYFSPDIIGIYAAQDTIVDDEADYGFVRRWAIRLPPIRMEGNSSLNIHIPCYIYGESKEGSTVIAVRSFPVCYGVYVEYVTFDFGSWNQTSPIPEGISPQAWENSAKQYVGNPVYSEQQLPTWEVLMCPDQVFNGYIFRHCTIRATYFEEYVPPPEDPDWNNINCINNWGGYLTGQTDDYMIFESCDFYARNSTKPQLAAWTPGPADYVTRIYLYNCDIDCGDAPIVTDGGASTLLYTSDSIWHDVPDIAALPALTLIDYSDRAAIDHNHTGSYYDTNALHDDVPGEINMVTQKTDLVGGDKAIIEDSEASWAKKSIQLESLAEFSNQDQVIMTLSAAAGELATGINPTRIYNRFDTPRVITEVFISVNTAPTGANIIVDILKDGVSIFGTEPEIVATEYFDGSTSFADANWSVDEYLQFEILQIGSGTKGSDLSVQVMTVPDYSSGS